MAKEFTKLDGKKYDLAHILSELCFAEDTAGGPPRWIGRGLSCVCVKRKGIYERDFTNLTPLQVSCFRLATLPISNNMLLLAILMFTPWFYLFSISFK